MEERLAPVCLMISWEKWIVKFMLSIISYCLESKRNIIGCSYPSVYKVFFYETESIL